LKINNIQNNFYEVVIFYKPKYYNKRKNTFVLYESKEDTDTNLFTKTLFEPIYNDNSTTFEFIDEILFAR